MSFKKLKKNTLFKTVTNFYIVAITVFIVWMLFFDENSYLTHRAFNKEIDKLKSSNKYYKSRIEEDKATIKKLQDSLLLERYAREKYLMKKENEDIYIIEFDTLKK